MNKSDFITKIRPEDVGKSEYKITKVTTRHYYVTFVRPFMAYKKFCVARNGIKHTPSTCFNCGRKFRDDETIYLGAVKKQPNKIFCEDCGSNIKKSLENE